MQRLRSERCERTFAHVCDTGGMRRSWLKEVVNVSKRYLIAAAAHNLGRILRKLFGVGKPRTLQDLADLAALVQFLRGVVSHARDALQTDDVARLLEIGPHGGRVNHRQKTPYFPGPLKNPTVVRDASALEVFPILPVAIEEAVCRALTSKG